MFRGALEILVLRDNRLTSLPEGIFRGLNNLHTLNLDGNNLTCLPSLPVNLSDEYRGYFQSLLPSCREEIIINKKTIRIDDPLSQVDVPAVLRTVADVTTGRVFQRAAKRKPQPDGAEQVENVVERVEYVIDQARLVNSVEDLLSGGEVRTRLQNKLDEVTGSEEYTVKLSAKPQDNVVVRISSNHPDAFVVTPQTLTFTPDNYNSPQTVRVRPAFTIANYVAGNVPSLTTLSHTSSSGASATMQIGVVGSQPIRERVTNALVEKIYPEVRELVIRGLCALNPSCRVALLAEQFFYLGQLIGEALTSIPAVDEALKDVGGALGTAVGTVSAVYKQGGVEGLVDYVSEQLTSSDGDPVPSVSSQPRVAVQSRIRSRTAPGFTTTAPDVNLSSFNQLLERSAAYLVTRHQDLNAGRFHLPQALAVLGTDFNVPLSSLDIARQESAAEGTTSAVRNLALWGSVDYSQFGDAANDFSIDGRNWTFTVGVDGQFQPSLLAGVALSLSTSRSDYDYFGSAMSGDYDVDLTVVSPYLNWSATDDLGLWASVGYGKGNSQFSLNSIGELELSSLGELDQAVTRQKQDSDFFSFAAGLRWDAFSSDHTQLAFKVAGSTTSFLERESQQARLAAEVSRDFPFPQGVLSSSLDLAVLLDRDNPSAMEVVGGLDWAAANDKFTASTVVRTLLFGGDRYEWGLGAALNYQAGVRPGEGLSLSLKPSFGVTQSDLVDLDILSTSDDTRLALHQWQPTARLKARLDYGIPTGNALLTPYTQLDMAHSSTTISAGLRYALDTSLDLDLSASHRNRSSGNHENRVFLQLRSDL